MKRTALILLAALLLCGCVRHVDDKAAPTELPLAKVLTRTAEPPTTSNSADEDDDAVGMIVREEDDPWTGCADGTDSMSISSVADLRNEEYRRRVQITLNIQDSEAAGVTVITRCMDGLVYVCNASADQRCLQKLNAVPAINDAMTTACAREELDGATLPESITDANAAFEWVCKDGAPTVVAQLYELDAMGFIKDLWTEIPAP